MTDKDVKYLKITNKEFKGNIANYHNVNNEKHSKSCDEYKYDDGQTSKNNTGYLTLEYLPVIARLYTPCKMAANLKKLKAT